ncbi:N-acetyltransferase family protein [Streptomyces sp. NPDC050617]|uniref:GNAT family N-acetyltransferase n=1 Tax=Streptomyces sp. NPDC050617 TaxID=3154628 RepID=UPI00343DE325
MPDTDCHVDRDINRDINRDIDILPAAARDLPGIVAIQNHTAATSHARFATGPQPMDERRAWFTQFADTGPYRMLVARRGEDVLGYACSQRFRDHDAFRETVEVSVGLGEGRQGQGLGTALYRALFGLLDDEPVHVVLAGIALPNDASAALHRKFGFEEVGTFREYAVKDGRYISSMWMQRLRPAAGS